ncbi:MAG: hypothetical protein GY847_11065 [Proteobacteria bacterium]|nr:hypothetical protein [Pseudomonadota bacterium]
MSERLENKPGMREESSAPGRQKQPKIAVLEGDLMQATSVLMSSGCEDGLCHGRQKRVETP